MSFDKTELYYIKSQILGTRVSLFDLAQWKNGLAFKKFHFSNDGVPIIKIAELNNGINSKTAYTQNEYSRDVHLKRGDLLFAWSGNPETSIDIFKFHLREGWLNQHIFKVIPDEKLVTRDFFYFIMKFLKPYFTKIATNKQTTGLGHVTIADLKRINFICPPLETQKKIAAVLSALDDKIELNNAINKNLEEQAQAIYKKMFVEDFNPAWRKCRADEVFSISIGKTPPRKEKQWFTQNVSEVTWVSISDMGGCGVYIGQSSEYLTAEAVQRFNVKIVPRNTAILSFKLTVGRVAITAKELTTNEAIAHFVTADSSITEYLYLYLKNFKYQTMGSTSSIATAINSKILKALPFIVPSQDKIDTFHNLVEPLFSMILSNQHENQKLGEIRDALLPRLMSGEIDVSNVKI